MPTRYEGSAREQLALNTFIKLQRAAITAERAMIRLETIEPLTLSQFGALEALYHVGPLCLGELGAKVLKSDGNMTLVVDNLERHGYVERRRNTKDRRMVSVCITEKGQALIEKIMPNHVEKLTGMMSVLTAEEQIQLSDLCRKLGFGLTERRDMTPA